MCKATSMVPHKDYPWHPPWPSAELHCPPPHCQRCRRSPRPDGTMDPTIPGLDPKRKPTENGMFFLCNLSRETYRGSGKNVRRILGHGFRDWLWPSQGCLEPDRRRCRRSLKQFTQIIWMCLRQGPNGNVRRQIQNSWKTIDFAGTQFLDKPISDRMPSGRYLQDIRKQLSKRKTSCSRAYCSAFILCIVDVSAYLHIYLYYLFMSTLSAVYIHLYTEIMAETAASSKKSPFQARSGTASAARNRHSTPPWPQKLAENASEGFKMW